MMICDMPELWEDENVLSEFEMKRGPAEIIVHYTPDAYGQDYDDIAHSGGDAAIETMTGDLWAAIEEHFISLPAGWYVVEGFEMAHLDDPEWGPDYEIKRVRPATGRDLIRYGYVTYGGALRYDLGDLCVGFAHALMGLRRRLF